MIAASTFPHWYANLMAAVSITICVAALGAVAFLSVRAFARHLRHRGL